jgi:hypothetical protein
MQAPPSFPIYSITLWGNLPKTNLFPFWKATSPHQHISAFRSIYTISLWRKLTKDLPVPVLESQVPHQYVPGFRSIYTITLWRKLTKDLPVVPVFRSICTNTLWRETNKGPTRPCSGPGPSKCSCLSLYYYFLEKN